jgi:hypothetical protein
MEIPAALPASSPVYRRGLLLEVGRVLERLAETLERLTFPERHEAYLESIGADGEGGGAAVFDFEIDVPWDFTSSPEHPVGRPAFGSALLPPNSWRLGSGGLEPIDLSALPTSTDAPLPPGAEERLERRLADLIREGLGEGLARFTSLVSASHFTRRLVGDRPEWRGLPIEVDTKGDRYLLRPDLREWLDRTIPTPESMARLVPGSGPWMVDPTIRTRAVEIIAAGFVAGLGHSASANFPVGFGEPLVDLLDSEIPEIPKPVFRFDEKEGMVAILFGPCVLDGERERAYFTVGASALIFDGDDTVGRGATREELPGVVAALRELAAAYRPSGAEIFGPPPASRYPEPRRPARPSILLDVRSRMDPETVKLATFAVQGALPRQWRKARRWEEAEEEKIETILREHGDAAFEKTEDRGALLTRRRGRPALMERERNLLTVELGTRGGFIRTDEDGEWLVRALRVGAGFVTVALSWFHSAEKLISDKREAWAKELRSTLDRAGSQKRLAFDELSDDEKGRIERLLEHIGTLEDARHLLDAVLRRAFATGAKVVDIPARELRVLLGCDGPDGRGNERIRRGFAALEHLSFKVVHKALKGSASGRFQGRFVSWHGFFAAGSGAHSDGIFVVELAGVVPGVATLLDASLRGKTSLGRDTASAALESSARSPATERSIELLTGTKAEEPRLRRKRGKGERPARAVSTITPWRKRALCETIFEERAFDFFESNLTTSLAPDVLGRPKRERKLAATTDGLRAYDRTWCPLLGDGRWVGVLGTHRRSPETGWTLKGRETHATSTGGRKPAGLIDQVGRAYPSGSAHSERRREALATLDDFAGLLGRLGGVLVGVKSRRGEPRRPEAWEWISLEEGRGLSTKELVSVRWYLFLPEEWARRADTIMEEKQAERVARGEGERPVFVTRSPSDYLAAAEADGIRWRNKPGEIEELETWPADGRERPAPDVRPLGDRLAEKIEASGMRKGDVAKAFGVSGPSLTRWLRPLADRDEKKGSGVPAALAGLVERWIEGGSLPTGEELEAVSARHGKPRRGSV